MRSKCTRRRRRVPQTPHEPLDCSLVQRCLHGGKPRAEASYAEYRDAVYTSWFESPGFSERDPPARLLR